MVFPYSIQNPESNQKRVETVIKRYGVDNTSKSDIVKKKWLQLT